MQDTGGWDIKASGLRTDHHAVIMNLHLKVKTNRGPGRWRLSSGMLKSNIVREGCLDALKALPGEDIFQEWQAYKITLKGALQTAEKRSKRKMNSLRMRLERQRKELWKTQRPGESDPGLDERLATVLVQEQCLEEWHYKNYSYNALAKHMLLDEQPTKWFFSKTKYD